jgi:hypothetical protein
LRLLVGLSLDDTPSVTPMYSHLFPSVLQPPLQKKDYRKSHLFDVSNGVKLVDFERTVAIDQRVSPLAISRVSSPTQQLLL